jgi:hypothetical protein
VQYVVTYAIGADVRFFLDFQKEVASSLLPSICHNTTVEARKIV